MTTAVQLTDCTFQYYGMEEPVLKHCSMRLHYGEFMVLSGPSGQGKSTLLSLLNGIIPNIIQGELDGEVTVAGQSVTGKSIAETAKWIGSVLQNADSQIVHDLVEDEIAFGCENLKYSPMDIERRVQYACNKMQLLPDWKTRTLSGGQKQRLVTASTLAMKQKILMFDEPLANLDLEGAQVLLQTLKKLTVQGYAVLFMEHRLDVVLPYADTVLWLENGRLIKQPEKEQALKYNMNRIPDTSNCLRTQEECFSLKNITYSISGRKIIQSFSLSVKKGERVVILGENGCGKTTVLRIIARLLKPTAGAIEQNILHGRSRKASVNWFNKVGYVYQNPNYQLFMPQVKEEIYYHAVEEDAAQCMEAFQLESLADMHPHALSEGQKRRVSIAAIAAGMPDLLLLDEPTVGQDYQNLQKTVAALNKIHCDTGNTMVTITHDYRCAAALADRVIWMQNGTVYKQGDKQLIEEYFMRHMDTKLNKRSDK